MGRGGKSTLVLNVISASGLKKVRTFGQDNCYAVAYIPGQRKAHTTVNKGSGSHPTWNSKLLLSVDGTETITVEIYSRGTFNNKLVGTSKISLRDAGNLINSGNPLSYQVCRPSGEAKGLLFVSMKVGEGPAGVLTVDPIRRPPARRRISCKVETSPAYLPTTAGHRADSSNARSLHSSPEAASSSPAGSTAMVGYTGRVYPTSSSCARSDGVSAANRARVYSLQKVSGGVNGDNSNVKVPVKAFSASGYGTLQLQAPNQCGLKDTLEFYRPALANSPYNYLQAYYSKPSKTRR